MKPDRRGWKSGKGKEEFNGRGGKKNLQCSDFLFPTSSATKVKQVFPTDGPLNLPLPFLFHISCKLATPSISFTPSNIDQSMSPRGEYTVQEEAAVAKGKESCKSNNAKHLQLGGAFASKLNVAWSHIEFVTTTSIESDCESYDDELSEDYDAEEENKCEELETEWTEEFKIDSKKRRLSDLLLQFKSQCYNKVSCVR